MKWPARTLLERGNLVCLSTGRRHEATAARFRAYDHTTFTTGFKEWRRLNLKVSWLTHRITLRAIVQVDLPEASLRVRRDSVHFTISRCVRCKWRSLRLCRGRRYAQVVCRLRKRPGLRGGRGRIFIKRGRKRERGRARRPNAPAARPAGTECRTGLAGGHRFSDPRHARYRLRSSSVRRDLMVGECCKHR
jgi:hypothetical protein